MAGSAAGGAFRTLQRGRAWAPGPRIGDGRRRDPVGRMMVGFSLGGQM